MVNSIWFKMQDCILMSNVESNITCLGMYFNRYKFSEESWHDLSIFFKTTKSHALGNGNAIWEKYLPKNQKLIDELNNYEENEKNIIDLTSDKTVTQDNSQEIGFTEDSYEEQIPEIKLNTTSINDLFDSMKENLQMDNCVPDDVIKNLVIQSSEEQINNLFTTFSESLDLESICKLGNSIISVKCYERNAIAVHFIKHILITKLLTEHSSKLVALFANFLTDFVNITCQEFSKMVQELPLCTKYLLDNINDIATNYKQKLLRDFIMNSNKLEQQHFGIIDSLLTNDLDTETIHKLIDLITVVTNTYSNDKTFGKLLLNLITYSSRKIVHFEQQFKHIASTHRSIWKSKIQKQLVTSLDNSLFSQSMCY